MNLVILKGRLGSDPEVRYTASGTAVCKFSLATSEKYRDRQGALQERTEWHRIVAWGKIAETCGQYCAKGQEIAIQGKVTYNQWEKDGVKRKDTEIVIDRMEFCGSGKGSGQGGQAAQAGDIPEDDIPF